MAFLACELPEANGLTVGIMALVAQREREAISRRRKEALAATGASRVKPGNPNGAAALWRAGADGAVLRATVAANAQAFADARAPILAEIMATGCNTLRSVAAELNSAASEHGAGENGTARPVGT